MDKDFIAKYLRSTKRKTGKKVIRMETLQEREIKGLERYRLTQKQREAWKRACGRLTGLIPHGNDGETLSEYIVRKRAEEKQSR
jgi:hypothetical protein